jgi:hypothetical protein
LRQCAKRIYRVHVMHQDNRRDSSWAIHELERCLAPMNYAQG